MQLTVWTESLREDLVEYGTCGRCISGMPSPTLRVSLSLSLALSQLASSFFALTIWDARTRPILKWNFIVTQHGVCAGRVRVGRVYDTILSPGMDILTTDLSEERPPQIRIRDEQNESSEW